MIHPMIAVWGIVLVLVGGFYLIYKVVSWIEKNQESATREGEGDRKGY